MSNSLLSHPTVKLTRGSVVAALLNNTEEFVKVHLFVRSMIRISPSLAAIFDWGPRFCILEYGIFYVCLRREGDVCLPTFHVSGDCACI